MTSPLLGGAIANALGVFAEGKLSNYQPLIDWDGKTYLGSEQKNLLPGQYSRETQLAIAVANSLIECKGFDPNDLSKRYVDLFASNIIRARGITTQMAVDNLIAGKHWSESGIAETTGNGNLVRIAPFAIWFRNDIKSMLEIVKIDSAITHASVEAEAGAIAISLATAFAINNDITEDILNRIHSFLPESKVKSSIYSLGSLIDAKQIAASVALSFLGTKANVMHTVPAVLYCFCRFKGYHEAVEAIIRSGNDCSTNAMVLGTLFGAKLGMSGIQKSFVDDVEDRDKLIVLDSQVYNRSGERVL
jgi:ADP-ribosyl-[dinitrogen reductase] hydrolase